MIFHTSRKYVHCGIKVNLKTKTKIKLNLKIVALEGSEMSCPTILMDVTSWNRTALTVL